MAKTPCAVFWDIQNIGVPKGQSAASVVSLIRSSIINLYNLKEIYFYCVCDVTKLPANVGNPLTNQDVNIIQAYDYTKDSADIKILDLMRKFVENQGRQGCAIILLSGDGDYAATLIDLKKLYNITIFVIRLATSFSVKLRQAANYAFKLAGGQLQPIRSSGTPQYFVSFSRFPISRGMKAIKLDLIGMTQPYGSIDQSAIDHDDEVIIGFPSLELANRAVNRLNTARYYGTFLKAEILQDPPSEIIIKVQNACSSVAPTPKPSVKKVPALEQKKLPDNQITFIKISQLTTDLLSEDELTHHFAKLTIPYESKYVKFHQSAIWIAFTNSNHAQECLNKLKSTLLLGKPVISAINTPPLDLLNSSMRQELSVSSKPSSLITPSPQSTSSSSSSSPSNSGNPLKNIPSSNLDDHHSSDRTILAQLQGDNCLMKSSTRSQGVNQNYYICLTGHSESTFQTKWSLTYKILFEIRDYHPKKLFIEDDTVWLWFTNEITHSKALTQLNSEFIKSWPVMKVDSTASSKINLSELVSSYCDSNPWCFTSDFELFFLKVDAIENFTDEIEKEIRQTVKETQVDHKLNCIFLKLNGGSIWAAFPDLMCCLDAEFLISTHQQIRSSIKLTWTKAPPIELLQSIGLEDLIGDARSLAELLATPVQSDESNNNDSSVDDTSVQPMVTQAYDDPEMKVQLLESESPLDEHQSSIEVKKTDEVDTLLELQSMNINGGSPTRFKNTFICLMGAPNATFPTHWSLFVFIVKKFIFMGLKKVILVNEIFWCKFASESDCQTVFKKLKSNQMNLLPLIHVSTTPQPTAYLTGQLAFHQSCNPLCITSELRLHYLKCTLLDPVTNLSTVDEMVNDVKKLLTVASKVIFVKADQYNTIWAGFPSGRTCDAAIVTIYKRNTWKIRVDLLHFKQAPLALLPLIQTQDLYGEALELSQRWMEHVKQSSSKLNSTITLSSSSSSLSSTSPTHSPKENKPARSGSQFEGQTVVPKVFVMKSGENVTQSTKKSRARKRGRAPRTSSSVPNIPSKQPIVAFATLNSNSMQFANIRNKFICLSGVTNAEFTTFWSLLYNIVAQTVEHRIYKVIMEGSDFWLYFDSENQCQEVIKKINQDSNFIKSMKMKKSISPSKKLLTTISSYHPDGPWCFTLSLGLNYLKSTYQDPKEVVNSSATARSLVNIIKSVSHEFKCIFVKFHEGTVWAAFPSIRTCNNAKKFLNATIVGPVFMQTVHPRQLPDNLLESIGTSDLIGDALTLSQQWFEMRNAPSNYSPKSSDENNLSPQINFITSMSIDSDTDSNSVISDHVNTDRLNSLLDNYHVSTQLSTGVSEETSPLCCHFILCTRLNRQSQR